MTVTRCLRPAVFIDQDGTLIANVADHGDPDGVRLAPGAGSALRAWIEHGFLLVVVTNQPGSAPGKFSIEALDGVESTLRALLAESDVLLDGFAWCLHAPAANGGPICLCRKPMPGMLKTAARKLGIDLARSWMVGDILDDVEAGRRAGCRTVLLDNGHEARWQLGGLRTPHHIARDLETAARLSIASSGSRPEPPHHFAAAA